MSDCRPSSKQSEMRACRELVVYSVYLALGNVVTRMIFAVTSRSEVAAPGLVTILHCICTV